MVSTTIDKNKDQIKKIPSYWTAADVIFFLDLFCRACPYYPREVMDGVESEEALPMSKIVSLVGGNPAQHCSMQFEDGADGAKIKTFLDGHSSSGITGLTSVTKYAGLGGVLPSPIANLDRRLLVTAFYADGSPLRFEVPAPIRSGVLEEEGERLPQVSGQALVDAFTTMLGTGAATFSNGTFIQTA